MGVSLQAKLSLVNGISQKDLPGILATSGEGMVSLDQKGRVLGINLAAQQLLGWNAEELLGVDFFAHSRFTLSDADAVSCGAPCGVLESVSCPHLKVNARLVARNNNPLAVSFMLVPLYHEGRVSGKLFIFDQQEQTADNSLSDEIVTATASIIVKLNAAGEVCFSNPQARWQSAENSMNNLLPASIPALLRESPHLLDQQTLLEERRIEGQEKEMCIAWSVSVTRNEQGEVTGAVCVGNDFTDQHHAMKGRLQQSDAMQHAYKHINDGVITVDRAGRVTFVNALAERLTGWSQAEARGRHLRDIYHVLDEQNLTGTTDLLGLNEKDIQRSQGNRVLLSRGGWEFLVSDSITPLKDAQGESSGAVLVFTDVSELRGVERKLEYTTSHDSLTGLINRRQFERRLQTVMEGLQAEGRRHALLHLDLDQFKLINESYGQAAGDQLLKELASLLIGQLAEGDTLGRLGGDEFGVILSDCPPEQARRKAKQLCRSVREYCLYWQDKPFDISVSIGLVPLGRQKRDLSALLRMADSACYVAKQQGRNRVHVYQQQDMALSRRDGEILWTQRIHQALKENRFRLYCQNIVPLAEDSPINTHYEILLRMINDEGKVLRPASFIAAAERYHLMPAIDRWVISSAIRILGERRVRGEGKGVFSINISGQSLDDDEFLGFVVDQFHRGNVSPESICFEITETTAASNLMVVQRFIAVLRGMGCQFALDDFGRGVSSFAYLKNLDVDYLKIDGMFVRDLADDAVGHAMVESINNISHIMGVQTIAEFVETSEVLEKLVELGVDHVQGYQLGHPRPLMPAFRRPDNMH